MCYRVAVRHRAENGGSWPSMTAGHGFDARCGGGERPLTRQHQPRCQNGAVTLRNGAKRMHLAPVLAARHARVAILALIVAVLGFATPAAAGGLVNSTLFGGVAIEGTDPVAYFTEGRAVAGSSDFEHEWMGATWRFASAENRDRFAAAPERYAPQYGGYCAWAVSQGYTAKIDPEAWAIVDGRLYLNYSKSVQKQWSEDVPGNIAKGDANWPRIRAELAG